MSRSIQQLPNNTNTSQTAEVYSAVGYSAGDLVYYQGGDYKPAGSLTTSNSVVFDNAVNLNTSSLIANSATGSVFSTTSGTPTGSTGGRFAAVLTNGNIVQAFVNTGPTPGGGTAGGVYFQIVDTSGVVQVAPTRVGTDVLTYSYTLEVVALTGGGFVVAYISVGAYVSYAIYTNTGSLTTALTTDTSVNPSNSYRLRATKLANGGFALSVFDNNTGTQAIRSYGATGTGAYAWVNTSVSVYSTEAVFGLSSRSDSSVLVAFVNSALNAVVYRLYNTSGTLIVGSSFAVTTSSYQPVDAVCLADGTTFVIGYFNQSSPTVPAFRLLPSSNTIGSQIAIPSANFNSGNSTVNANVSMSLLAQSSGGFAMVFGDYFNTLAYAFFNSSGTALSGTNGSGTLPITIPIARSSYFYYVTMVEISGFVNLYWNVGLYTQAQSNPNQVFAQINSTTYALAPRTSTVAGVLGSTTVAAGTAVVASATPANTKFYPATTATNSYSTAFGATVLAPSTIAAACYSIASCTLPNGQFVIAYNLLASPYTVFANVYSSAGALLTTINVTSNTGYGGVNYPGSVKVAALSSGKFVVGFANSTTVQFTLALYSSTFTYIGEQTVALYTTFGTTSWNFDIAGLGASSDRYVVAYSDSNGYPTFAVYNNSNTRIVGPTNIIANTTYYNSRVAADFSGGFGITNGNTGGSNHFTSYIQTGSTTYSVTSNYLNSLSAMTGGNQQSSLLHANNGYYIACTQSGTAAKVFHAPINQTNTTNQASGNIPNSQASLTTSITQAFGLNGNGNLIFISMVDTVNANLFIIFGGVSFTTNNTALTSFPTNATTTFPVASNTSNYPQYSISPQIGGNFVLAWLGASNIPTFAIYNSLALAGSFTITAGVTPSNTTSISPLASTSTSVAPNTVLAGVAVTGATAGSTGQVAINGLAQLNSNYPSGTNQAFDFTGQVIDGVKGVINGRTVNMQGNS